MLHHCRDAGQGYRETNGIGSSLGFDVLQITPSSALVRDPKQWPRRRSARLQNCVWKSRFSFLSVVLATSRGTD